MRPLIALLLFSLSLCANASELQVFALKHRPATELIPMLRPMLDKDAAITGSGYTLVVRGSQQDLARITTLLEQLDRAPVQLLILVQQGANQQEHRSGAGISGSSEEQQLQARLYSDRGDETDHISQQLRVMEGQWAAIRAGQAVPQVVQRSWSTTGHTEQRIEYRNVESGFEVRPRLNGDRVTLDIRPFRANLARSGGAAIEQQQISTTVSGQLGEWIELGGMTQNMQQSESGIIYSTAESGRNSYDVRLKVERIND